MKTLQYKILQKLSEVESRPDLSSRYAQLFVMPFGPIPAHALNSADAAWWSSESAASLLEYLSELLELNTLMKNQLIPITPCPESDDFQPALIPHGYQYRQLVKVAGGGYHTKVDHQGFSFRPDLEGRAHRVGYLPIIELDDGGLFAIRNADAGLMPLPAVTSAA